MNKKFNSNLYTQTRIVFDRDLNSMTLKRLENDYLFSNVKYPTKITAKDLPEWYVQGVFYRNEGYINTKNVVDVLYKPNWIFNHLHKDDTLYISYKDKIYIDRNEFMEKVYKGYDYAIRGSYAFDILKGIKEYSPNVDIKEPISQMIKKTEWFIEHFPYDAELVHSKKHLKELQDFCNSL